VELLDLRETVCVFQFLSQKYTLGAFGATHPSTRTRSKHTIKVHLPIFDQVLYTSFCLLQIAPPGVVPIPGFVLISLFYSLRAHPNVFIFFPLA
jgi:hypothetical protein